MPFLNYFQYLVVSRNSAKGFCFFNAIFELLSVPCGKS